MEQGTSEPEGSTASRVAAARKPSDHVVAPLRVARRRASSAAPGASALFLVHERFGNDRVRAALSAPGGGMDEVIAHSVLLEEAGMAQSAHEGLTSNAAMLAAWRKASDEDLDTDHVAVRQLADRNGQPLPEVVRRRMESAFGHGFEHVRLHLDSQAAQAAEALNAKAFTLGSHVFFAQGQWAPGSPEGDRLLAHELTHVQQHDEGELSDASGVSDPSDRHEVEAYGNEDRILGQLDAPAEEAPVAQAEQQPAVGDAILRQDDEDHPAGDDDRPHEGGRSGEPGNGEDGGDEEEPPDPIEPDSIRRGRARTHSFQITNDRVVLKRVRGIGEESQNQTVTRRDGAPPSVEHSRGPDEEEQRGVRPHGDIAEASTSAQARAGHAEAGGDHAHAEANALTASANASAAAEAAEGNIEVHVAAGLHASLLDGDLKLSTGDMGVTRWYGEQVKFSANFKVDAEVAAHANGQLGLAVGHGEHGLHLGAAADLKASAGARAGFEVAATMEWKPVGSDEWEKVAGFSVGGDAWAGAAAALQLEFNLMPEIEIGGKISAAFGIGGGCETKVTVNTVNSAMLLLTLAGRGVADALDGTEAQSLSDAINRLVTGLWSDNVAHGAIHSNAFLCATDSARAKLLDHIMDAYVGREHQEDVAKVIRLAGVHAEHASEGEPEPLDGEEARHARRALVDRVVGRAQRILRVCTDATVAGEVSFMLLDCGYDVPLTPDLARQISAHHQYRELPGERCAQIVEILCEHDTGPDDERAVYRVIADRWADLRPHLHFNAAWIMEHVQGGYWGDAIRAVLYLAGEHVADEWNHAATARAIVGQHLYRQILGNPTQLEWTLGGLFAEHADPQPLVEFLTDTTGNLQDFIRGHVVQDAWKSHHLGDYLPPPQYARVLRAWFAHGTASMGDHQLTWGVAVAVQLVHHGYHQQIQAVQDVRLLLDRLLEGDGWVDPGQRGAAIIRLLCQRHPLASHLVTTDATRQRTIENRLFGDQVAAFHALLVCYHLREHVEVTPAVRAAAVRWDLPLQAGAGEAVDPHATLLSLLRDGEAQQEAIAHLIRTGGETLYQALTLHDVERVIRACTNHQGEMMGRLRKHAAHTGYRIAPSTYDFSTGLPLGEPPSAQARRFERFYGDGVASLELGEQKMLVDWYNTGARALRLFRESPLLVNQCRNQHNGGNPYTWGSLAYVLDHLNDAQKVELMRISNHTVVGQILGMPDDSPDAYRLPGLVSLMMSNRIDAELPPDQRSQMVHVLRRPETDDERTHLFHMLQRHPSEASQLVAANGIGPGQLMAGSEQDRAAAFVWYHATVERFTVTAAHLNPYGELTGAIITAFLDGTTSPTTAEWLVLVRSFNVPGHGEHFGEITSRLAHTHGEEIYGSLTHDTDFWQAFERRAEMDATRNDRARAATARWRPGANQAECAELTPLQARAIVAEGTDRSMSADRLDAVVHGLSAPVNAAAAVGGNADASAESLRVLLDRHDALRNRLHQQGRLVPLIDGFSGHAKWRLYAMLLRRGTLEPQHVPKGALREFISVGDHRRLDGPHKHAFFEALVGRDPNGPDQRAAVSLVQAAGSGEAATVIGDHDVSWLIRTFDDDGACTSLLSEMYRKGVLHDRIARGIWANRQLSQAQVAAERFIEHRLTDDMSAEDKRKLFYILLCRAANYDRASEVCVNFVGRYRSQLGRIVNMNVAGRLGALRLRPSAPTLWGDVLSQVTNPAVVDHLTSERLLTGPIAEAIVRRGLQHRLSSAQRARVLAALPDNSPYRRETG